jgi:hypothetical protein
MPLAKLTPGLVFLAVSAVRIVASAQNPEPFRSEVKEVRVPIVVVDSHSHHISGLKASNFQIFEDGSPQTILAFHAESLPAALHGDLAATNSSSAPLIAPNHPAADVPSRTYLIILDTLHTAYGHFSQAQRALSKFFEAEPAGRLPVRPRDTRQASARDSRPRDDPRCPARQRLFEGVPGF